MLLKKQPAECMYHQKHHQNKIDEFFIYNVKQPPYQLLLEFF
jgi:hypothetical protein